MLQKVIIREKKIVQMTLIYLFLILVCQLGKITLANEQDPDKLIYEGLEYSITKYPLEDNLLLKNKLLKGENFVLKSEGAKSAVVSSSSCWRGYHATWEIKVTYLYLIDLTDIGYNQLSFKNKPRLPLKADWFSGLLTFYKDGFEVNILIKKGKQLCVFKNKIKYKNNRRLYVLSKSSDCLNPSFFRLKFKEKGWIDLRFLRSPFLNHLKKSGRKFKIRGHYETWLSVPYLVVTQSTNREKYDLYELHGFRNCDASANFDFKNVELVVSFEKVNEGYHLIVYKIILLDDDQPIVYNDFP